MLIGLLLIIELSLGDIYFSDRFSKDSLTNWTKSKAKSKYGQIEYYGGDKTCNYTNTGMQTTEDNKFYAISANFDQDFNTTGKDLVFLYTMRAPERLGCTGSYMKLMSRLENAEKFDDSVASSIIFGNKVWFKTGPDVCGTDVEIKLMVEYNGKLYKLREKVPYMVEDLGEDTHLFTLILLKNHSYEVRLDNKFLKGGDLLTDLDLKEPRMIQDSDATKPIDWDDREEIPDPNDVEPDDWVKDKLIKNENETKPNDWDEELFGEWEPRVIVNPKYKGEYRRTNIANPNYMGKWSPPMILNPYFTMKENAFEFNLGSVGLEVWQVNSKTIFSSIFVSDSINEGDNFVKSSFMMIPKSCERHVTHNIVEDL